MNFTKIFPILSLGLIFASGCTVKCHFSRTLDLGKEGLVESFCRGKVVTCNTNDQDCKNRMQVECDGVGIYSGDYRANVKDDKITYTATQWEGDDAPVIVTKIPQSSDDTVDATLFVQDTEAEGSCDYDIDPAVGKALQSKPPKL